MTHECGRLLVRGLALEEPLLCLVIVREELGRVVMVGREEEGLLGLAAAATVTGERRPISGEDCGEGDNSGGCISAINTRTKDRFN